MTGLETVRENWTGITDKLLRNKQLSVRFLRFSAGMYTHLWLVYDLLKGNCSLAVAG